MFQFVYFFMKDCHKQWVLKVTEHLQFAVNAFMLMQIFIFIEIIFLVKLK